MAAAFSYYWLSEGDNNTSFFHACATARRWNSDIKILQRPNGDQCTSNPEEIKAIVVNYFSDLFTSRQTLRKEDILPYLNIIPNKVSLQHNEILFAPYMKLPGPSFRLTQIKLQAMMVSQQLSFSTTGRLSNQILFMNAFNFGHFNEANNSTLITLIPIQKGAVKVTDFRPISVIGVMAKVVSKAIVNRLQQFLDEASLKLDMAKVYDKMEWDFLDLIMKKLGFAELWVDRVLSLVRSARYCIRVNRDISDFFYPTRGLRQGDLLSPYLFIICTEWLSYTLKHYADLGRIEGIQISRRSPSITHLLFADDCLIFMRIHSSTVIAVKNVLQCYESISGQTVNYGKSKMALSRNCPTNIVDKVTNTLRVQVVPQLSKYLGLPIHFHRKKTATFMPLIDKLWNRIQAWQNCKLSIGGKEVLISAVLNVVPQFW
ncbi:unnamed protein product [Rhodiola kirilowii]